MSDPGFAYIEYSNADDAQNAMKHMDGGQIDGQVSIHFVMMIIYFLFSS